MGTHNREVLMKA